MMVFYLRRKIKLKYVLSIVCLTGIIYTIYQIRSVQELTKSTLKTTPTVRGVHMALHKSYQPDINDRFYCLSDGKSINFDKVNDDYCDCEDGSDEPGTEACPNGLFYCTFETNHRHAQPISSSRVNDGICDCCDGSDEWKKFRWSFTGPCSNVC